MQQRRRDWWFSVGSRGAALARRMRRPRVAQITRVVGTIATLPRLDVRQVAATMSPTLPSVSPQTATSGRGPDALEKLRKLGELRGAGVLTAPEFEAKKEEFLRGVSPTAKIHDTALRVCPRNQ